MIFQCRTKQDLIIAFKFPGRRHLGFRDVIRLLNYFTQNDFYGITIATTITRHKIKIQNGGAKEI